MTALDIANAIIYLYGKTDHITNVKLNKLVYFAYARNLRKGSKLFDEQIEAWSYGAVVPSVYHAYKRYKDVSIHEPASSDIPSDALEIACDIWGDFGRYGACDLMNICHKPGSAWDKLYTSKKHTVITDDVILTTLDGDAPEYKGTFQEAIDNSLVNFSEVLQMLADS